MTGPRRPPADGGFTLVELLATMVVSALLGLAVVSTVSSVARGSTAASERIRATEKVQTLSDRLLKSVRAAHPLGSPASAFDLATGTSLTVYTDAGDPTGPRRVSLTLSGTSPKQTLTETSIVPAADGSYPAATATSRVLAVSDVDATAPLFTYYDGNGAALVATTADLRSQIARVRVALTVREGSTATPTTVDSLVYLRNVEYR